MRYVDKLKTIPTDAADNALIIGQALHTGIEKGIEKGESRLNQLNFHLISDKRFDDLARATNDRQYQAQLYKEYGL